MAKKSLIDISHWRGKYSDAKEIEWESHNAQGTLVISVESESADRQLLVRCVADFYVCIFEQFSNSEIQNIKLENQQNGFQIYVKSKPQLRERRFVFFIDPMVSEYQIPERMEFYWEVMEDGLRESNVLQDYREQLNPQFSICGTASVDKQFVREINIIEPRG